MYLILINSADDLTAEMPSEGQGTTEALGSSDRPLRRKHGRKLTSDEEAVSAARQNNSTVASTQAPLTNLPTTAPIDSKTTLSPIEGREEATKAEGLSSTSKPVTRARTTGSSQTLKAGVGPHPTPTAASDLQPSRSDSLKKSLLALGDRTTSAVCG